MSSGAQVAMSAGYVPEIGQWMAVLSMKPASNRPASLRHTVLVLDCSLSMIDELASMKHHAQDFVRERSEDEYLSAVVFSGHGRARLLAGPVKCDEAGQHQLCQAIQQGVVPMDTTVFSEPLELVLRHLSSAHLSGMTNQAVLFTDGCAVPTQWDASTETSKALTAAAALYQYGATMSAIGYGPHYDEAFVQRLMETTHQGGVFRHLSDVTDFTFILRDIQNAYYRSVPSEVDLEISFDQGEAAGVFQTLPEVAQVDPKGRVTTRYLYQGGLTRYLALNATTMPKRAHLKGTLDGQTLDEDFEVQPLTGEQQANCAQLRVAHLVLSGQTAAAGQLLAELGDEQASEQVLEAHTTSEQRQLRDRCRHLVRRPDGFIGSGLKPSGPNHCVLNVLALLASDSSVVLSLPAKAYRRGGLLRIDPRIVESPLGRTLTITSYTSEQKRFNFSFMTEKDVKVLAVDSNDNILPDVAPEDATVYRTYNLIRDGELVISELWASMAQFTFEQLQAAGVIESSVRYQSGQSYQLNLRGMKMVSSAWARPNALLLTGLLQDIAELAAKQTALNAHLKAVGKPEPSESASGRPFYREQSAKLEVEPEYYAADCVELKLASVQTNSYTTEVQLLSSAEADQAIRQVRRDLRALRWRMRCIVFACELTGWGAVDWGEPKVSQRSANPRRTYTATLGGQLVKRVVWTEMIPCS